MSLSVNLVEVVVIVLVALLIVSALRRGRGSRGRAHDRTPPPLPRAVREPDPRGAVNAGQLILAVLFFPFVLLYWVLASLGDLVTVPVQIAVGMVLTVLAVVGTLVGGSPVGLWRTAGRRFTSAGRAGLSVLTRLLECFGLGGLVEEMKEDMRRTPPALPAATRRPPATRTYPFEDRYRIESHLGTGGSTAKLFVVRRMSGRRPVGDRLVLKYFDMGMGSHLEEVIRESRGMQVAKDMGIVLDHRLEKDHFYYVMPYYEGETLTRAAARLHRPLATGEGMPPEDVQICLGWMAELLRILDGYHRHGVIHKDVKPDNVIVTDDGIRLVDLGLLTPLASALTLTTHGTEYFRDPEMVRLAVQGKRVRDVDAVRFDVYSAGAVMYLLLEGSFPACGPLSRFSRPVPMALSWITSRAMAEGAKRYPTIAAMRADLEAALRLAGEGDLAAVPANALPSFGGFDAAPPPDPAPAYEAAPVRQAAFSPPPPEKAPRRTWSAWQGIGCLLLALVLLGGAAGVLVLWGWAEPPRSQAQSELTPELLVSTLREWEGDVEAQLGRAGADADLRDVPVLLVVTGPQGWLDDLARRTRTALLGAGFLPHPSTSLAEKVRERLRQDIGAGEVNGIVAEEVGADTLPIVLWLRDLGYRQGTRVRLYELRFYYRSVSRTRSYEVRIGA